MNRNFEINESDIRNLAKGLSSGVEVCIKMLNNVKVDIAKGKYDEFIGHQLVNMMLGGDEVKAADTVVEVCPHCDKEVEMRWNIQQDGYVAHCPYCGNILMLCDECMHDENGNVVDKCDFHNGTCFRRCDTGLVDCNGRKVHEGDIIRKNEEGNYEVCND